MIISHFHRFILVKPRKVAGTTIELTLSPFLERGDLATSIEPDEEKLRRVKDGVKVGSIYRANKFGFIRRLRDHSSLQKAYSIYGNNIKDYKIISICRNPWDRAVSQFFWSYRKTNIKYESLATQKKEFAKFTKFYGPTTWLDKIYGRKRQRRLDNSTLYTIQGKIFLDYVIRFENLEEDLLDLSTNLNFVGLDPKKYRTKTNLRSQKSKNWQDYYDYDTKMLVYHCCNKEVSLFNYDFDGKTEPKGQQIYF